MTCCRAFSLHSLSLHLLLFKPFSTELHRALYTAQEALPALYMLDLQSHPIAQAHVLKVQASITGSHFSKAYVRLLIKEVQSVLASAGLPSAAQQANQLLQACKPGADAQALQLLMQDTVRSSAVGIDYPWR